MRRSDSFRGEESVRRLASLDRDSGVGASRVRLRYLAERCHADPPISAPPPVATVAAVRTSPIHHGKFVVGLVTDVGGLGDKSFNDLAWKAVRGVRKLYHGKALVIQPTSEIAYLPDLKKMVARHASLVVAIGASMAGAIYQAAGQYPKQRFVLVDARPMSSPGHEVAVANVANVLFNEGDSGYLAGALAGLMERRHVGKAKHNTIGYLGAYPIPQIVRYLAGYVAGATAADPKVKVVGQFADTYVDAKLGKKIADAQIHAGADVLFQVAAATGAGYLQEVNARRVYGIGSDVNQSYIGRYIVTSALKRVDVAVASVLRDDVRGKFRPGDNLFDAANGGTGISPPSALIPGSVVAATQKFASRLTTGAVTPPLSLPAR